MSNPIPNQQTYRAHSQILMEPATSDLWALLLDECDAVDDEDEREREMARKRRARYREKKRGELTKLREESSKLEAQLALLLQPKASQLVLRGGWHGAAVRQLRRRVKAEELNRELRSHVTQAQMVARQLEHVYLALRAQTPSPLLRQPRSPMQPVVVHAEDVRRVTCMVAELEAMYVNTDAVLGGCERPTSPNRPCTWEIHRRWDPHQDTEFVEMVESRAVPFVLEDAVSAAQHALVSMLTKVHSVALIDSQQIAGATGVKFTIVQESVNGNSTERQGLWAGRVIIEASRAVLCWKSVSFDVTGDGGGPEFYEHGWGVARPLISSDSSGTKFTFSTRYSMGTTNSLPVDLEHGRLFEKFAELVTQEPEQEAADWLEAMEDAVLYGVAAVSVS